MPACDLRRLGMAAVTLPRKPGEMDMRMWCILAGIPEPPPASRSSP